MDTSGRDLLKLCRVAKSSTELHRKIRQRLENVDTKVANNFDSILGCDEVEQRAALNYLLASHNVTKELVEQFLNETSYNREWFIEKQGKELDHDIRYVSFELQSSSVGIGSAPSLPLHNQCLKGITALHLAVYQNSLHANKIAKLLLSWKNTSEESSTVSNEEASNFSIASIPMRCGSCPLHILTGQNLTIKEEVLKTLLHSDPCVAFRDDVNGDNPISLLWKNTLRFRWAISIMEGASYIDYIKNDDCSWMAIITPHQFIKFSLLMAAGALQKKDRSDSSDPGIESIHDVCKIPRCPPMLLRLLRSPKYNVLFGIQGNAYSFDRKGMLPIHHAVQSPPVTYDFVPSTLKLKYQKSLVEILLEENPNGVRVADDEGRLPLHYALDCGCLLEKDLLALIKLYPESLRMKDPRTGLLPFMLVAAKPRRTVIDTTDTLPDMTRYNNEWKIIPSMRSTCRENYQGNATGTYQAEWKKDHVRMSCLLLMLYPDVIPFQTFAQQAMVTKNDL